MFSPYRPKSKERATPSSRRDHGYIGMSHIAGHNQQLRVALIQATGGDRRSYGLPLSIGYLAAYLRAHAGTIPASLEILPAESLNEVLAFKPHVVGISSVTSCFNHATDMARNIKDATGARIIAGGHHVTALPHCLPDCLDAAVIGEGEETLRELLAATTEAGWSAGPLSRVAGIAYHDGRHIAINDRRPLIHPLDTLPRPLRASSPTRHNEATIFTSRGCPYACVFCSSARHWQRFRAFSAEYVVAEIEEVINAQPGVLRFYILDDLFIANRARLRRIVELLEDKGLASRLSFRGFVRSNLVDEECCELLLRMNCREVRFGAESASPRILEQLKVGSTTVEDHQRCIDLCGRYGLDVSASYMVGNPGESERDLRLTYDFILRNKGKAGVEGFYLATPLPGTPLWDDCLRRGLVSEDMDWSRLNLAFDNPDFDWRDFIYVNDAMPRQRFVESVRHHGLLLGAELKVEVGPGDAPEPGFLHVDVRPGPHVEYVTSATSLPFPDASVSHVYTRHCLEHLTRWEGEQFVAECLRVLRPGGTIHLIVPNMAFHIEQFHHGDRDHACAGFWGWQRHEHDMHKWGYWWETLSELLLRAGFSNVENLTAGPKSRERSEMHLEVSAVRPAVCLNATLAAPSLHLRRKVSVADLSALIALDPC